MLLQKIKSPISLYYVAYLNSQQVSEKLTND